MRLCSVVPLFAWVLLVACPEDQPTPEPCTGETFTPGLEKTSKRGSFKLRIEEMSPSPPTRGDNIWKLRFFDPAGTPIAVELPRLKGVLNDGDRSTIPPWTYATPAGETGTYTVGPFNPFVEGSWTFTVEARAGAMLDETSFSFCVGGALTDAGVTDSGAADAAPVECNVTVPTSCTDPQISYDDVAPIIEEKCLGCHDGAHDQWPLTTYDHVVDWYAEIRGMMINCAMPPPAAQISMTDEDREELLLWILCGYPR